MLTDQEINFANVYSDFLTLKQEYIKLKDKLQLRTWLLTPVVSNEDQEDLVIANVKGHLFACLYPKKELTGTDYIKVKKNEIKIMAN